MKKYFGLLAFVFGWIGIIFLNYFLFKNIIKENYFLWYVKNGTIISIISGFILMGIDREGEKGFISSNIAEYFGSYFQTVGISLTAFSLVIGSKNKYPKPMFWDSLMGLPLAILLFASSFVFILITLPLQYITDIFFNSIARLARSTQQKLMVNKESNNSVQIRIIEKTETIEESWKEIRLFDKPSVINKSFAAIVFFIVNQILKY